MRRSGFTLIEILVVITIMGLMMLIGLPRLREAMGTQSVAGARTQVQGMYLRARMQAMQTNRRVWLKVDNNRILAVARPRLSAGAAACGCDTVGTVQRLDSLYHVTVTPLADSIAIDPRGMLGLGGDLTITLQRGSHQKTLTITTLGRIQ